MIILSQKIRSSERDIDRDIKKISLQEILLGRAIYPTTSCGERALVEERISQHIKEDLI